MSNSTLTSNNFTQELVCLFSKLYKLFHFLIHISIDFSNSDVSAVIVIVILFFSSCIFSHLAFYVDLLLHCATYEATKYIANSPGLIDSIFDIFSASSKSIGRKLFSFWFIVGCEIFNSFAMSVCVNPFSRKRPFSLFVFTIYFTSFLVLHCAIYVLIITCDLYFVNSIMQFFLFFFENTIALCNYM